MSANPPRGRIRAARIDAQSLTLYHYRLETKGTHSTFEFAVNQVCIDHSRGDTAIP